jgi:hypothetical protein
MSHPKDYRQERFDQLRKAIREIPIRRQRMRDFSALIEKEAREEQEWEREQYGPKPIPFDDKWAQACRKYGESYFIDTDFLRCYLEAVRTRDARDLGPFFFDVKGLKETA